MSFPKVWRRSLCSTVLLLALVTPAQAQIDINSSPNIVGSGARALGMGGAFIAVADDATAASWNPGGLTQLELPEISAVYSWEWISEGFNQTHHILSDGRHSVRPKDLNYLSIVYPIRRTFAGRNFVLSLNYQQKYDFERSFDFLGRDANVLWGGLNAYTHQRLQIGFDQKGSLSALSPAFGFELTDRISCGVVMNIWDHSLLGGNQWDAAIKRRIFTDLIGNVGGAPVQLNNYTRFDTYKYYEDFEGTNYTLGLLCKPAERLSVGAVYHTELSADVGFNRIDLWHNPFTLQTYSSPVKLKFPAALGIGVAYRFPNDKLTLAFDVTRRDWDDFLQIDHYGGLYTRRVSPVTGLPKCLSPHDPTYSLRLGAEYVFVDKTKPKQDYLPSLRGGIFYDPQPASGRQDQWWGIEKGDGEPDDYYGVALGAGVLIKNRVNIDAVYEYRWGNNVRRDTLAGGNVYERRFGADFRQHTVYLSTVIYF